MSDAVDPRVATAGSGASAPADHARSESSALLAPQGEPEKELELLRDIVVQAYTMAQDAHNAQCFCFTSAPEQLRRDAHSVARDGFNELARVLGPGARPILKAEYDEARKAAAAERASQPSPVPPQTERTPIRAGSSAAAGAPPAGSTAPSNEADPT